MERTAPSLRLSILLVALYLGAIVAANLAVAAYGARAMIVSAFVLIPFDLCARDVLHERWRGRGLAMKMALLVVAGSAMSYLVSASAGRVALASMLAFGAAATVDALVYHYARRLLRFARMNLSNLCAAVVDSIIFPLVAFGATTFALSAGQSVSKFIGGLFWSAVFVTFIARRERRHLRRV